MRHLNDQYYGGNLLREVGAPAEGMDAANKAYVDNALDGRGVRIYRNATGTAAKTSSPYYCSRWDVADPSVAEYYDGLAVCVKVPVAGNNSYGTALQINSLGYKPVVYNISNMIGTRYSVGSVVWMVYNAAQTATLYLGSGSQTVTGCWQVMDYDSTNCYQLYNSHNEYTPTADSLRHTLLFRKDENHLVPIHSTASSGTNTSSTATNKVMTTESFDPFGEIIYYNSNARVTPSGRFTSGSGMYIQYNNIDARYVFNCGQTLVAYRELYLVVDLQSDGSVKLATEVNPWSQTLPSTADGHLYIFLGFTYSTYQFSLYIHHPIYYHDGTRLRMYTGGPAIPTLRTMNGEQLTDDTLGDINIHDGYYFPNAVQDYDGNWYGAVVVGGQVWMAENLRTTHTPGGTAIAEAPSGVNTPGRYNYSSSNIPAVERGLLYNWHAVMNGASSSSAVPSGVQGIAPAGWHVPSADEWGLLKDYVAKQKRYANTESTLAKALASTVRWSASKVAGSPGNAAAGNNATGFNAVPAGTHDSDFDGAGEKAAFWSATVIDGFPTDIILNHDGNEVSSSNGVKPDNARSVRCVSDLSPVQFRDWYVRTYGTMQHHLPAGGGQLTVKDDNNGNIGLSLTGGSQSLVALDDNNGNITLILN